MKKVALFLYKNTHHTIQSKKSYFFLSIRFSFTSTTCFYFTLEVEGVVFFLMGYFLHKWLHSYHRISYLIIQSIPRLRLSRNTRIVLCPLLHICQICTIQLRFDFVDFSCVLGMWVPCQSRLHLQLNRLSVSYCLLKPCYWTFISNIS